MDMGVSERVKSQLDIEHDLAHLHPSAALYKSRQLGQAFCGCYGGECEAVDVLFIVEDGEHLW